MNAIRHFCLAAIVALTLAHLPNSSANAQTRAADVLDQRISQLWAAGRYAEAIPLAEQSLAIRENALGPDHLDVARALRTLAGGYVNTARYAEAEPLLKRSLAIYEKALGPDHPDVATALHDLAALYQAQNRFADAEPLYQRTVAIREKALGPDHPDVAGALNNLAGLYRNQSRLAEAEPLLRRSLTIYEKALGPNHPNVAIVLNNQAEHYKIMGRYAEAEPLLKRSLAILERALGPNDPKVATALSNLAGLFDLEGRYAEAEPLLKRSLAIREKAFGVDNPYAPYVAESLSNLAANYSDQGRYAEAEPLLKRSLAIYEKELGPDHLHLVAGLENLAGTYILQGRYAEAEPLLKRSLAIKEKGLGPDHLDVTAALFALALLYDHQGRYAEAEPLYKRSLAVIEKAFGNDHPTVAQTLHSLGELYSKQGRYAEAEPLLKRSLAIREKALGADHPEVASSLNDLISLYNGQSRYAEALPIVRRLVASKTAAPRAALPALFGAQTGKLIGASEAIDDSLNVMQRTSQTAAGEALNALAVRFAAGNNRLAELVRKDQDLKGEAQALDKALITAASKDTSKRDAATEQRIRERIAAIGKERDELGRVFQHEFPDYAALSRPEPMTVKDIQPLLADDEALVIVEVEAKKSYVWAITTTAADWKELAVTVAEVSEKVSLLRGLLDFHNIKPFDAQASFELYRTILAPIEAVLRDKPRLSLVLNGALTSLPPQLLVTRDPTGKALKDVDWLVRSHAVTVLPSVASLKVLRGKSAVAEPEKPLIGFANPLFNRRPQQLAQNTRLAAAATASRGIHGSIADISELRTALPPLPETADELRQVAASVHADPKDLIIGADATETRVKQAKLDLYRIVYFATHGLLAGDVVDFAKLNAEPALVLSLPEHPTEVDDGLLTASEVAQLKLNADWVVLSACNTASGEKPGAEALSGLARAFFYAGARSLIVSNWAVDSDSAVALMTGTFAALAANPKLSHGEALQKSMLAMIDDGQHRQWADPKFWAPFIIVGEPAKPTN